MAATQTTITLPGGATSKGYIIDGKTYLDAAGTARIPAGTIVDTQGGRYLMGSDGQGSLYNPSALTLQPPKAPVTQQAQTSTPRINIDDLIGDAYNPMSEGEINSIATALVDPAFQNYLTDLKNEEGMVNARYSPLFEALNQTFSKAGDVAQGNLSARGLGDSGLVDYERNKLEESIAGQITGLQNQQQAEIAGLSNRRITAQRNYGNDIVAAAQGVRSGDRQTGASLISARVPLINSILDKTVADANNVLAGNMEATKNIGYTADNGASNVVGLRDSGAGRVGWDGKNVLVDGKTVDNATLTSLGGQLRDGRWYLPQGNLARLGL